ncbi:MAG: DUF3126 family protein [Alphaproteobacteria bacterium]|nr:DUF3126 family protein [Alphaproteobacteria bacterium]
MSFTAQDMVQLKTYIERKFKCSGISMKRREKADDSVEVMLDGEFIGVIYKDTDEGETSYDFNMAILDIDLTGTSAL